MLRRWGVLEDNLVLSTRLIMIVNWPSKRDSKGDVSSVSLSSLWIPSNERLTLETSAFESRSLYGSQFTLSTQLIKPNYPTSLWREVYGFYRSYQQFEYRTERFPALVLSCMSYLGVLIGSLDCVPCDCIQTYKRGERANSALFLRQARGNKFVFFDSWCP